MRLRLPSHRFVYPTDILSEYSVRVFQLVAEDTVEDRVLDIQKKKEKLISQAFSGNKNGSKEKEKIGTLASTRRRRQW